MFGFPFLGLVFDIADGRVARWMSTGPSMLGQELDSFSDLISFGIAPACLAWTIGLRSFSDKCCLVFFITAGIARLARFNVTQQRSNIKGGKQAYFEGLPIPSSLFIVAIMWYWVESGILEMGIPGGSFHFSLDFLASFGIDSKNSIVHLHSWSLFFVVWACCMVSRNLRIPKL
jgi:CDP-diacylglycerol--serine O-phosphatidyltransferase